MMTTSRFWSLVVVKVRLGLKSEAAKSYLNYVWWILEPALFVAIFYLVFGVLLARGGPDFVAFLVCGKIPFLWYSRSVTNASGSMLAGKALISQVYIPKVFFPLVVILQDFVKQFWVFVLLLVFLLLYGVPLDVAWWYLPFLVLAQGLFITASGFVAALLVPVVPDFRYVISTGMLLLMFGSGTFYSYKDLVDVRYQEMFLWNPMAALIKNYRQVLLEGAPPDIYHLLWIALVSGLVAWVAARIMRSCNSSYSRLVLQ